jgi:hypothetical protein
MRKGPYPGEDDWRGIGVWEQPRTQEPKDEMTWGLQKKAELRFSTPNSIYGNPYLKRVYNYLEF